MGLGGYRINSRKAKAMRITETETGLMIEYEDGTDYRTKFAEVHTILDGLLLLDSINKELDEFEQEGTSF